MKQKCSACHGKGGWTKAVGRGFFKTVFVSCQQCHGKGR